MQNLTGDNMIGSGTIVNTLAVVVGGILGLFVKNLISKSMEKSIMSALGISTMFIGIGGTLSEMFVIDANVIKTKGIMLLIISITLGTIVGELLDIEGKLATIGDKIKNLMNVKEDDSFVSAFVTTTLIICVGAMAIVGAIKDGLTNDPSILYAKSILDGLISVILASSLGMGTIVAAIPLFLYQGSITVFAKLISKYLSPELIGNLSYVGSVLIFAIGLNMIVERRIKVGNMLPALLVPIVYELFNMI